MTPPEIATEILELDVVELRRPKDQYAQGTRGTVVSAEPTGDQVTVEFEDSEGEVDLVTVDRLDLALVQRAADAALSSRNGR
jgi:hypothetical protein